MNVVNTETGEIISKSKFRRIHSPNMESNPLPSMTIPDSTLPLRTLIERYVRGIPPPVKQPFWDAEDVTTDDYLPDPKRLDLAERQELAQNYAEEIQQYKDRQRQFQLNLEAENALKIDSTIITPKTETNEPTN